MIERFLKFVLRMLQFFNRKKAEYITYVPTVDDNAFLEKVSPVISEMGLSESLSISIVSAGSYYNPLVKSIGLDKALVDTDIHIGYAVGCHEMGHALQDQQGLLKRRNVWKSNVFKLSLLSALVLHMIFGNILITFIPLYCLMILDHLSVLYIEYDASRRAKDYLRKISLLSSKGNAYLNTAFSTYIVPPVYDVLFISILLLNPTKVILYIFILGIFFIRIFTERYIAYRFAVLKKRDV